MTELPEQAYVIVSADNSWRMWVNGQEAGQGDDWMRPGLVDVTQRLRGGENVIAIEASNGGNSPNAAGLMVVIDSLAGAVPTLTELSSNSGWRTATEVKGKWTQANFDDSKWKPAIVAAASNDGPWGFINRLSAESLSRGSDPQSWWGDRPVRAALASRDTLQATLGRPNREQPVTRRDSQATLLQALELTNGASLDGILREGASRLKERELSRESMVQAVYVQALGRDPTATEAALAAELLGDTPDVDQVADLLWVLVMLPEFQLIP
ncbi:MAG: DUF1553 domain-containing protein [Planctomycetaceae bacterium]